MSPHRVICRETTETRTPSTRKRKTDWTDIEIEWSECEFFVLFHLLMRKIIVLIKKKKNKKKTTLKRSSGTRKISKTRGWFPFIKRSGGTHCTVQTPIQRISSVTLEVRVYNIEYACPWEYYPVFAYKHFFSFFFLQNKNMIFHVAKRNGTFRTVPVNIFRVFNKPYFL